MIFFLVLIYAAIYTLYACVILTVIVMYLSAWMIVVVLVVLFELGLALWRRRRPRIRIKRPSPPQARFSNRR